MERDYAAKETVPRHIETVGSRGRLAIGARELLALRVASLSKVTIVGGKLVDHVLRG